MIPLGIDIPLSEILALGLDLGLYLLSRAVLRRHIQILKDIRDAPKFDNLADLRENLRLGTDDEDIVHSSAAETTNMPYVVIEGRVEPIDGGISSQFLPHESGVIKTFAIKDHKVERRGGLWHEKSDNIQESHRDVPFKIVLAQEAALQSAALLKHNPAGVEFRDLDKVDNPLHGELDVTYDKFNPSSSGFGKALMENFRGDVSKGIQETEKMLLVGTKVTAIGKIVLRGNGILMVSPSKDYEYILTKKTYEEVMRGYEDVTGIMKVITYVLSITGVFLSGLLLHRIYREIRERRQYSALLRQLSEQRRESSATHEDLTDAAPVGGIAASEADRNESSPVADCVVCLTNPRNVILLSCGHVCVCADCAEMLPSNRCPMCRSYIDRVQPFFIA